MSTQGENQGGGNQGAGILDGGGSPQGTQGNQPQNNQSQQQQQGQGQQQQKVEPPKRPDGLDDQFWDAEKGVKVEDLIKSHGVLKAAKAELDVRATGIPVKADDYKLNLKADDPQLAGLDLKLDDKDPLVTKFRKTAFERKMTQEDFDAAVNTYVQHQVATAAAMRTAVGEELKKLGENGKARVDAVTTALKARLGDDGAKALLPMMFTAAAVQAIEKLLRSEGQGLQRPADSGGGGTGKAWGDMSPDEKLAAAHTNARNKQAAGAR